MCTGTIGTYGENIRRRAGGGTYHWALKRYERYVAHLVTHDPTYGGRTGVAPLILSLVNRSRLVIDHLYPSEGLHMEKKNRL